MTQCFWLHSYSCVFWNHVTTLIVALVPKTHLGFQSKLWQIKKGFWLPSTFCLDPTHKTFNVIQKSRPVLLNRWLWGSFPILYSKQCICCNHPRAHWPKREDTASELTGQPGFPSPPWDCFWKLCRSHVDPLSRERPDGTEGPHTEP